MTSIDPYARQIAPVLEKAGFSTAEARAWSAERAVASADLATDNERFGRFWRATARFLERLPAHAARSADEQAAAEQLLAAARNAVLRRAGWAVEADGLFGAPPIQVLVGAEGHPTLLKSLGMLGLGRSRGVVLQLAGLQGLDALAGGFIMQSLVAYWLRLRFDASRATSRIASIASAGSGARPRLVCSTVPVRLNTGRSDGRASASSRCKARLSTASCAAACDASAGACRRSCSTARTASVTA